MQPNKKLEQAKTHVHIKTEWKEQTNKLKSTRHNGKNKLHTKMETNNQGTHINDKSDKGIKKTTVAVCLWCVEWERTMWYGVSRKCELEQSTSQTIEKLNR